MSKKPDQEVLKLTHQRTQYPVIHNFLFRWDNTQVRKKLFCLPRKVTFKEIFGISGRDLDKQKWYKFN